MVERCVFRIGFIFCSLVFNWLGWMRRRICVSFRTRRMVLLSG